VLWLLRGALKNREVAERILRERGNELTEEQRRYLLETVEMGRRAEDFLKHMVYDRERGVWIKKAK